MRGLDGWETPRKFLDLEAQGIGAYLAARLHQGKPPATPAGAETSGTDTFQRCHGIAPTDSPVGACSKHCHVQPSRRTTEEALRPARCVAVVSGHPLVLHHGRLFLEASSAFVALPSTSLGAHGQAQRPVSDMCAQSISPTQSIFGNALLQWIKDKVFVVAVGLGGSGRLGAVGTRPTPGQVAFDVCGFVL